MRRTNRWVLASVAAVIGAAILAGCAPRPDISVIVLPEKYNTPDGMTVDGEGNIILSVPNYNDRSHPPKLVKISPNDEITEIVTLPKNPGTGKDSISLGVAVGSDGNLYVADNQAFDTDEFKSRLLRVVMKDGKAVKVEAVVTGMIMANGVAACGDRIYVCESKIDPKASPAPSGVYGFKISELKGDKPVKLLPGGKDPHLAIKFFTKSKVWPIGANGLGFDKEGNMLVCNFGDAQLIRAKMGADGKAASQEVLAEKSGMLCTDGLSIDRRTGEIYIADFLGNAVHRVHPKTGKVTTIAKNGNTDGSGGALDRPSEPCVRGNKVYVANIDLPLAGNKYDKPHTLTVITLPPLEK